MNYLYSLEVHATNEDGESIKKLILIEAFSEESLLEQLRKADKSIKDYEDEMEVKAQFAMDAQMDVQREEGELSGDEGDDINERGDN